jgi:hypothetical protein
MPVGAGISYGRRVIIRRSTSRTRRGIQVEPAWWQLDYCLVGTTSHSVSLTNPLVATVWNAIHHWGSCMR